MHEFLSVSLTIFESRVPFSQTLDLIPSSSILYPPSFLLSSLLNNSHDHVTNVHLVYFLPFESFFFNFLL